VLSGSFFAALSITLTIAVMVSLLLALSIIPLMADQFLTEEDAELEQPVDRIEQSEAGRRAPAVSESLDALSLRYQRSLGRVLHHPRRMLLAGGILIVAGVLAQRFVGTGFLPEMMKALLCSTTLLLAGRLSRRRIARFTSSRRSWRKRQKSWATSRRTGAELGLFATEQNRGDIVARSGRKAIDRAPFSR